MLSAMVPTSVPRVCCSEGRWGRRTAARNCLGYRSLTELTDAAITLWKEGIQLELKVILLQVRR
jgi:hypothetical protein